MHVIIEHFI